MALTTINISTTNHSTALNDTAALGRHYSPLAHTPLTRGAKTAAYVVLLMLTFVGNVLVVHTIRRNPTLRSTVDLLIVNMCVSDLFIPIFAIPYHIKMIYVGEEWFDGDLGLALCKLIPFAIDITTVVSILSMLAIAVERFRAVVYPTKPTLFTVSSHRRLIALIWMITVIAYCVYFYVFNTVDIAAKTYCVPIWLQIQTAQIYFTCEQVLMVAIPTVLLFVLYTAIIKSLHRQEAQMASHIGSEALRRRATQNKKITIMLIIALCIFVLSYVPFAVYTFLKLYSTITLKKAIFLQFVSILLIFVPSAVNPVIYFTFNDRYRQGLRQLLCSEITCQSCCGRPHGGVNFNIEMQEVA